MTTWPTGAYAPAPDPQPAALPDAPEPLPVIVTTCPDPECVSCRVAAVGGATICRLAGVDYDALPPVAQGHYNHVATEVMAAMSDALIEWGVAVPVTEVPE